MQKVIFKDLADEVVLQFIIEGSRDAFAEIYNRYWEILINTAFQRLKSIEASEEVVQDVFLNLFLRRNELNFASSVEAYLKTALKYKIYNLYRSQQLHYKYLETLTDKKELFPVSPDHILEAKDTNARIKAAAEKMPERCREVFLLSRFDQLSHKEIADQLNISVSTVKKQITKALGIMRVALKGHELDTFALFLLLLNMRQ